MYLQGYVELALLAAFARLAQHMGREPGQRPDEVPDNVIAQANFSFRHFQADHDSFR